MAFFYVFCFNATDDVGEGRFPTTRRPEKRCVAPALDFEIYIFECVHFRRLTTVVIVVDVFKFYERSTHNGFY